MDSSGADERRQGEGEAAEDHEPDSPSGSQVAHDEQQGPGRVQEHRRVHDHGGAEVEVGTDEAADERRRGAEGDGQGEHQHPSPRTPVGEVILDGLIPQKVDGRVIGGERRDFPFLTAEMFSKVTQYLPGCEWAPASRGSSDRSRSIRSGIFW